MKWKLCLLSLLMCFCAGCMAKTQARLTYTANGMPDVTFFDNKSRQGVKLEITPQGPGLPPKINYEVKVSDANAVAIEALGLAQQTTGALLNIIPIQ